MEFNYNVEQVLKTVKQTLGDFMLEKMTDLFVAHKTESGKSVAIVESGPAGLSAAYYLRKAGHSVAVFEELVEAGGGNALVQYTFLPAAEGRRSQTVASLVQYGDCSQGCGTTGKYVQCRCSLKTLQRDANSGRSMEGENPSPKR